MKFLITAAVALVAFSALPQGITTNLAVYTDIHMETNNAFHLGTKLTLAIRDGLVVDCRDEGVYNLSYNLPEAEALRKFEAEMEESRKRRESSGGLSLRERRARREAARAFEREEREERMRQTMAELVARRETGKAATFGKFRELFGIDLDAKWDGPTTDFKLEKNFGPFRSGYVYTNEVGLVYQVQLVEDCLVVGGRNYEKLNQAEVERYGGNAASNVLPHVERDLKAAFVGMADFRPRQGRPEYVYGTTSELPGVYGWHVACYAYPRCDEKDEQGKLRIILTFWTSKKYRTPAIGDRGAAPVRASP